MLPCLRVGDTPIWLSGDARYIAHAGLGLGTLTDASVQEAGQDVCFNAQCLNAGGLLSATVACYTMDINVSSLSCFAWPTAF